MKTPLQVIADYGCPTNSYIAAIKFFSERQTMSFLEYRDGIQNIIGLEEPPDCESLYYARTLFLYCVQETIRIYLTGRVPTMEFVYEFAMEQTMRYIDNHPWAETQFNIEHGIKSDEDAMVEAIENGAVITVMHKGGKKELTEKVFKEIKAAGGGRHEIIQAFIDQIGMTKAGSTTYFHTLKKELGFSETSNPNKETPKAKSKQEIAEQLYAESPDKSKAIMIALFTEKLDTSKLGAQTYYYACKKKFGEITQ